MPLTETAIKRTPNPDKEKLIGDERGLYLRMYPSGRRTWLFRTRVGGSWKTRNLGEWPTMTLAEARVKASALSGKNLPNSVTFGSLLDEWFKERIEPRYKVTKNIETYVNKGRTWAGNERLSQMTTARLVALLKGYAEYAPVSANRCLSNWKLALDYAVQCGYVERNPLERTTANAVGGEEKSRDRTLSNEEIHAIWQSTHRHAALIRFLLLTGLRISEAQQGYVDGDRFRADHTKNGSAHWVFLPPLALEQLARPFDTSPTSVQSWLKHTYKATFTPHDCRRTFATRLGGLGVEPYIIEKCLNHTMQGVMGIYNRAEYERERIAAATAWADELQKIITSKTATSR